MRWKVLVCQEPQESPVAAARLTFVRSTPVMARTDAGISASRRFASDTALLLSPLRIRISSTLERGAATLAAIWGGKEGGWDEQRAKELLGQAPEHRVGPLCAPRRPGPAWESPGAWPEQGKAAPSSPQAVRPAPEPAWQLLRTAGALRPSASSPRPLPSLWPRSQKPPLLQSCGSFLPPPEQGGLSAPWRGKRSPPAARIPAEDPAPLPALPQPAPWSAHELVFTPTSPQPSAKPGSELGQAMGSLTSRPRRSAGYGRLQPRPAASQWRSAPSPFG